MHRRRILYYGPLALGLALAIVVAGESKAQAPATHVATAASRAERPTAIVLISIDTMRADALSLDDKGTTTPFLRSLAKDSLVFSRAYATSSWTAPSMASLMSGLWPQSHGIRRGMVNRLGSSAPRPVVSRQPPLSESFDLLGEKMKAAGFKTIGVAANVHLSATLGFAQGFDHYYGDGFIDAAEVNLRTVKFLEGIFGQQWEERWRQKPTFLWLHYFDPHMPYQARRPWITQHAPDFETDPSKYPDNVDAPVLFKKYAPLDQSKAEPLHAIYRSEVSYVDDQLRKLNNQLHFDAPDVMVIVTADHGEEFGEHRGLGHANTLYEETVRVPLFIRWPAGWEAARRDQVVSLVDIYPTLAELIGQSWQVQGRPLPRSDGDRPTRPIFLQTDRARPPLTGVIDGNWKLIRSYSKGTGLGYKLFDLKADPAERVDQFATQPEVADRLAKVLSQQADKLPRPPSDTTPVPVDPSAAERLRALGYD